LKEVVPDEDFVKVFLHREPNREVLEHGRVLAQRGDGVHGPSFAVAGLAKLGLDLHVVAPEKLENLLGLPRGNFVARVERREADVRKAPRVAEHGVEVRVVAHEHLWH